MYHICVGLRNPRLVRILYKNHDSGREPYIVLSIQAEDWHGRTFTHTLGFDDPEALGPLGSPIQVEEQIIDYEELRSMDDPSDTDDEETED